MRTRSAIVWSLAMVVILSGLMAWAWGAFEPRYAGVPATKYLLGLLEQTRFGGKEDREKTRLVPARVAVPILTRVTYAQDPRWGGWFQRVYPHLPRVFAQRLGPPKSKDSTVVRAVMALGYYGPEAQESLPGLLQLNATTRSQVLHQALLNTFGNMGPSASNAIPALLVHLQSNSTFLAGIAATALGKIDPKGERSGAALVSTLRTPFLQRDALDALAAMATNDSRWITDIWQATESASGPDMIQRGVMRLHALNALDRTRVQTLLTRSDSNDPIVRMGIVSALAYATDHAEIITPVALRLCGDSNAVVRNAAVRTLLQYTLNTNIDLRLRLLSLQTTLSSDDDTVKWSSLSVVRTIGPPAAALAPQVIALLSDKNERVRGKATEAVAVLGSAAKNAEPILRALLDDRWEFVRDGASAALKQMASHTSTP